MTFLPPQLVLVAVALYALLLLAAGRHGERGTAAGWTAGRSGAATTAVGQAGWPGVRRIPWRYGLSLGTMCSAWTYFGGVGTASTGSWLFLAYALGPVLALTLGFPLWRRIAIVAKQENVGSLADFLAARYGKSALLGALCALVATLGALPYIALQIDLLHCAWTYVVGARLDGTGWSLVGLPVLILAALACGARRPSLGQHNTGFITAVSVEACVKLAALVCGGAFAIWFIGMGGGGRTGLPMAPALPPLRNALSFPTLLVLCAGAAFTLPRQFHVGFVTLQRVEDTRPARWVVMGYFGLWALATLMLALAVRSDPGTDVVAAPLRMLALAGRQGPRVLLLILLLGGLSAGAAMVVVELCAVSTMITNEITLPLLRRIRRNRAPPPDAGRWILWSRAAAITLVAVTGWGYFALVSGVVPPDDLGQAALAASAQFLPALIGGVFWRRGHVDGAVAGIATGSLLCVVTAQAPALLAAAGTGPRDWGNVPGASEMTIFLSISVNVLLYVVFSLLARPRPVDTIQANIFVGAKPEARATDDVINATLADMEGLLARFIGKDEASRAMLDVRTRSGEVLASDAPVTLTQARMVEKLLAGIIGAPSARNVLSIALPGNEQSPREIDRILDEAAHAVHFNRGLLQNALQGLDDGVSVVDRDLRLIAWNARYIQMLNLSPADIYIGKPLSDLLIQRADSEGLSAIRSNLLGLNGSIARGEALEEEWRLEDGSILKVTGKPLTRGEYLSTLTDITRLRAAERVLAQDKEALERRVEQRTAELVEARRGAELATAAQKRFVAAASHDLVQPLHAARLFIASVRESGGISTSHVELLRRAEESVDGAHRLMRALLNLSRLETAALQPALSVVQLDPIFASLCEEFADQSDSRGLRFVVRSTDHCVTSDADLLKSVLQNLVGNAIRYTPTGTVLVAARVAGPNIRIEVRDSGIGIAPNLLDTAFGEYSRLPEGGQLAEGSGLGLAIVTRICQALGHPVSVRSVPGRGSMFSVLVPRAAGMITGPPAALRSDDSLDGMSVLCIDDEPEVLAGMRALLEGWGARTTLATRGTEVPDEGRWDAIVADHLLPGETGLSILRRMAGQADLRILLTATAADDWITELPLEGIHLVHKPVLPPHLRALLASRRTQLPGFSATIETR